jgi:hypothetical protein
MAIPKINMRVGAAKRLGLRIIKGSGFWGSQGLGGDQRFFQYRK